MTATRETLDDVRTHLRRAMASLDELERSAPMTVTASDDDRLVSVAVASINEFLDMIETTPSGRDLRSPNVVPAGVQVTNLAHAVLNALDDEGVVFLTPADPQGNPRIGDQYGQRTSDHAPHAGQRPDRRLLP